MRSGPRNGKTKSRQATESCPKRGVISDESNGRDTIQLTSRAGRGNNKRTTGRDKGSMVLEAGRRLSGEDEGGKNPRDKPTATRLVSPGTIPGQQAAGDRALARYSVSESGSGSAASAGQAPCHVHACGCPVPCAFSGLRIVVQPLSTEHLLLTVPLGQGRCVQDKVKDKYDATEKLGNLGRVPRYGGRRAGTGVMVSLVSSPPQRVGQ